MRIIVLLAALAVCGATAADVELRPDGSVSVPGAGPDSDVRVWVEGVGDDIPPVAGRTAPNPDGGGLFRPAFPFLAGTAYRVTIDGRHAGRVVIPRAEPAGEPARVEAIFPSAGTLPENVLRFYIQFSEPMRRGDAYQHITLLDANGQAVPDPFLELEEELWDPEGRRFTLLLDPGRVKRGLKPHEEAGPVLVEDKAYQLVVDSGWKDARGEALAEGFAKSFRTAPADREQPDPAAWNVLAPAAGSRDPLTLEFAEPLDRALALRLIEVLGIVGAAEVRSGERAWQFVPDDPWPAGEHTVEVAAELEDPSGNSIRKPFEVEGDAVRAPAVDDIVEIKFRAAELPVSWNGITGENVAWRTEIPGDGASTPAVGSGMVFVTSQTGSGPVASLRDGDASRESSAAPTFLVIALDRGDGRIVWEKHWPAEGALEAVHPLHNLATPTCAVDHERVVALFGTGQLVCLDHAGAALWSRHLGAELHPFELRWGHASSPVLRDGRLYLLCDHDPAACLVALDAATGRELWRVDRGKNLRSYSTPVLAEIDGALQIIVNSNPGLAGYNAENGSPIWQWDEFCKVPVPSPALRGSTLIASRGYTSGPLMALDLSGVRGTVPESAPIWRWKSRAPYVSSPVLSDDLVYLANESGHVFCVDAETGSFVWSEKLGTRFWATPAVAGGHVYLFDESGEITVVKDGPEFELVSRNPMPGEARGSLTIHGDSILARTAGGVLRIGAGEDASE